MIFVDHLPDPGEEIDVVTPIPFYPEDLPTLDNPFRWTAGELRDALDTARSWRDQEPIELHFAA